METNSYTVKIARDSDGEDSEGKPKVNTSIVEGEVNDDELLRKIIRNLTGYMEPFNEIKEITMNIEERIW